MQPNPRPLAALQAAVAALVALAVTHQDLLDDDGRISAAIEAGERAQAALAELKEEGAQ